MVSVLSFRSVQNVKYIASRIAVGLVAFDGVSFACPCRSLHNCICTLVSTVAAIYFACGYRQPRCLGKGQVVVKLNFGPDLNRIVGKAFFSTIIRFDDPQVQYLFSILIWIVIEINSILLYNRWPCHPHSESCVFLSRYRNTRAWNQVWKKREIDQVDPKHPQVFLYNAIKTQEKRFVLIKICLSICQHI